MSDSHYLGFSQENLKKNLLQIIASIAIKSSLLRFKISRIILREGQLPHHFTNSTQSYKMAVVFHNSNQQSAD